MTNTNLTVELRPDHDTTPHCDLCGAEHVSFATLPLNGVDVELCEDCEHCADVTTASDL